MVEELTELEKQVLDEIKKALNDRDELFQHELREKIYGEIEHYQDSDMINSERALHQKMLVIKDKIRDRDDIPIEIDSRHESGSLEETVWIAD